MTCSLLNLYHRLPAPARSVAASMRGYYLRSWRYGLETERLVDGVGAKADYSIANTGTIEEFSRRIREILEEAS